ncbi:MAG: thioesterase family protein [Pseudomonadota bacterium]
MARPEPTLRSAYPQAVTITSRWADNDIYGHINNAAYYNLIDTAVNRFMIANAGIDIHNGAFICLVVETSCRYHAALAFPEEIEVALKVARLGTTSVTWAAGLFPAPAAPNLASSADAHFVHVLVDRHTRRPQPWPDTMRDALTSALG